MTILKENAKAHVVFDNDGTMVDSERNFHINLTKVLPTYLNREVSLEEVVKNNIPDWVQLLKNFGFKDPDKKLIQSIIDDVIEVNQGFIPELFSGIKELITDLHKKDVATYVWTGRDSQSGLKLLKAHKMTHLFHEMQFMDTSLPKPHPDGLNKMLGDVCKSKIVLIGDSIVDINGAKDFNIPCLIVDWHNKSDHQDFINQGATDVMKTNQDILNWVTKNLLMQ